MRTIKELLILMSQQEKSFETGLCHLSLMMVIKGIITRTECSIISSYIRSNAVTTYRYTHNFYWPKGVWGMRHDWLMKQISKLD